MNIIDCVRKFVILYSRKNLFRKKTCYVIILKGNSMKLKYILQKYLKNIN